MDQSPPARLQCRLLTLPPELRNKIYHHVLVSPTPIHLSSRPSSHQFSTALAATRDFNPFLNLISEPALLGTCKQIRRESLAIFYSDNIFFFCLRGPLLAWLKVIGPEKRAMLRCVKGFRSSRYFSYASAVKFLENVEGYLKAEGVELSQGVFSVPFGVDGLDGRVFWMQSGCEEVRSSTEGEIEDDGGVWRGRIGEDGECMAVEKA